MYVDGQRRGLDDGYRCDLVSGLRSSADARRLLEEIGFASARLDALATAPQGAYALAAELGGQGELERASWLCLLIAYLSPLDGEAPFASISKAPSLEEVSTLSDGELDALELGPRSCHEPGRGAATLRAYLAWAQRAGSQRMALIGEESWSAERRFERVFERLAIPGFPRWGRYELLVILGGLRLYEMSADSLHLAAAPAARSAGSVRSGVASSGGAGKAADAGDPVLAAAKRVFGIGDVLLIERRAKRLAEEMSVPIAAVELGLFNWHGAQRATLGFAEDLVDSGALARGAHMLGL